VIGRYSKEMETKYRSLDEMDARAMRLLGPIHEILVRLSQCSSTLEIFQPGPLSSAIPKYPSPQKITLRYFMGLGQRECSVF